MWHAKRSGRQVLQELRSEAVTHLRQAYGVRAHLRQAYGVRAHLRQAYGVRAHLRLFISVFVICCSLLLSVAMQAQVEMPDPSAIAGTPLPAPELPDRT